MHSKKFPGFPPLIEKSHWQFPTIINGYVNLLTSDEFKVLWYILRHTFGWQKSSDKLSVSQICNGIKKRNGEIVDSGTGVNRRTAFRALKSLEDKKFIKIKRTPGKPNEISPYFITSDRESLVTHSHHTSDRDDTGTSDTQSPTINKPINNTNIAFVKKITTWAYERSATPPSIKPQLFSDKVASAINKHGIDKVDALFANETNAIRFLTNLKNL